MILKGWLPAIETGKVEMETVLGKITALLRERHRMGSVDLGASFLACPVYWKLR